MSKDNENRVKRPFKRKDGAVRKPRPTERHVIAEKDEPRRTVLLKKRINGFW